MKRRQFKRIPYRPDFARYEQLKRDWLIRNQGATYEQYQEAMRRIAAECRI